MRDRPLKRQSSSCLEFSLPIVPMQRSAVPTDNLPSAIVEVAVYAEVKTVVRGEDTVAVTQGVPFTTAAQAKQRLLHALIL